MFKLKKQLIASSKVGRKRPVEAVFSDWLNAATMVAWYAHTGVHLNQVDTDRDPDTSKRVHAQRPRRKHASAFKREVVEACLKGDASVSIVARQYDVNANQVFKWRKQYREGLLIEGRTMLPVIIEGAPAVSAAASEPIPPSIELQLPGGRVALHGAVDGDTLRQVVALLLRR